MAVRDLLWGCPLCRVPGAIRPLGRRERCRACGAEFRRGRGARIAVRAGELRHERGAAEWLAELGPVIAPSAGPDGLILGPEPVRVKVTTGQKPLHFGDQLLGWVETYGRVRPGILTLRTDGLHFQPARGQAALWRPDDVTGLQPASSSLQVGLRDVMASVRFLEGSVRLWTRAVSDLLHSHYRHHGREVVEFQPFIRTARASGTAGS